MDSFQIFDFDVPYDQLIDPSFLGSFYEDTPQSRCIIAPAYPQAQKNDNALRPHIEQPSFDEIGAINEERDMIEDFQEPQAVGFPEINPEANQHFKEEKLIYVDNSTSNALKSTGSTNGTATTESDSQYQVDTQSKGQNNNTNSPIAINASRNQQIVIRSHQREVAQPKRRFNDKQITDMQRCHFQDQDVLSLPKYLRQKVCSEKAKSAVLRTKAPSASFKEKNENGLVLNPISCNQEDFQRKETMILAVLKIAREKKEVDDQALAPHDQNDGEVDRREREEAPKDKKGEGKKQKQNPKKHVGGLIVRRVFDDIGVFLKKKEDNDDDYDIERELSYIEEAFAEERFVVDPTSKSKFCAFIEKFAGEKTEEGKHRSRKTYKWVREHISKQDRQCARVLRGCVNAFLSERGSIAMEFWIRNSKKPMIETTKDCLRNKKEEIKKTFQKEVWDHVL